MFIFNFLKNIDPNVFVLCVVSFLGNVSAVTVFTFLPLFMTDVLAVDMKTFGFISAMSEVLGFFSKITSGIVSDYIGKRKVLLLLGYAITMFVKPILAVTNSINWFMFAQFLDRFSNGIRDTPRDALITDFSTKENRGSSFALRNSFATLGSVFGSILVIFLARYFRDLRDVFWFALLPLIFLIFMIVFSLQDSPVLVNQKKERFVWDHIKKLPLKFWSLIFWIFLVLLGRFSDNYFLIRIQKTGVQFAYMPYLTAFMFSSYAFSCMIITKFVDNLTNFKKILAGGILILIVSHAIMFYYSNFYVLLVAIILLGLNMGITQIFFPILISYAAPKELRATSFGFFNIAFGMAMSLGKYIAGYLADHYQFQTPYLFGIGVSVFSLLILNFIKIPKKHN